MTRRTTRGVIKKSEVLAKLEVGRRGAVQVRTEAKINSDEYQGAGTVMDAIDNMAEKLTGDRSHFHAKGYPW